MRRVLAAGVIESATRCDAPQPDAGWTVLVAPAGRVNHGVCTTVTDDFDGAFRIGVANLESFEPGGAFAAIEIWDYALIPPQRTREDTSPQR